MKTELLLKLAALAHLGLIAAGLLMPRVTGLWQEAEKLAPFARSLFRTYYLFIGLCLVGFGLGSWVFAPELAGGSALARGVCGFLAAFWTLRLFAAVWLLDVKPFLRGPWRVAGYHATNVVFSALPVLYGWLAVR